MANSLGAKEVGFWIRAPEETIFFPKCNKVHLGKRCRCDVMIIYVYFMIYVH